MENNPTHEREVLVWSSPGRAVSRTVRPAALPPQALPLAPSSISRTVTKLVDKGLIQRRRLLSDRRVVILTLTQEGMALTQDLHRRVQAYEAELCGSVSDEEMGVFTSVTSTIMANYAAQL